MAHLEQLAENQFEITGNMTFHHVVELFYKSQQLLEKADTKLLHINLEKISAIDSAGLSFLMSFSASAQKKSIFVHYLHVPDFILNVAKVHHVEDFLNDVPQRDT